MSTKPKSSSSPDRTLRVLRVLNLADASRPDLDSTQVMRALGCSRVPPVNLEHPLDDEAPVSDFFILHYRYPNAGSPNGHDHQIHIMERGPHGFMAICDVGLGFNLQPTGFNNVFLLTGSTAKLKAMTFLVSVE